jgi:hypothetical protein
MTFRITNPELIKIALWQELTAQKPGIFPSHMTGPLPGLIGKSVVGAGLGYLAASPLAAMNKNIDKNKAKRILPLMGAGAMAAWSAPQVMGAEHKIGWNQWADTSPPQPKPVPLENDIAGTKFAGTSSNIDDVYEGLLKAAGSFFGAMSNPQPGELGLPGSPKLYGGVSPYTPGLGITDDSEFPVNQAISTVLTDTGLNTVQRVLAIKAIGEAAQKKQDSLITSADLVRGAVGAGVGYGVATMFGKTLGAVFGLPAQTQRRLSQMGAVGGLLNGIGVLKY